MRTSAPNFCGELAGLIDVDHDLAVWRRPQDLDCPTPNDKEVRLPVARLLSVRV